MAQTIITPENLESIKAKLEENDYYWVHIEEKQKPIIHQFTLGALFMCGTGYCSRFESIYSIDIYPIIYSTPSDGLSAEDVLLKHWIFDDKDLFLKEEVLKAMNEFYAQKQPEKSDETWDEIYSGYDNSENRTFSLLDYLKENYKVPDKL